MDAEPIRYRWGQLVGLVLAALVVGGAFGGLATWKLAGPGGMGAMAAGCGAAIVGFAGGLAITVWQAGRGVNALAMGFLIASPARVLLTLSLATLVWWVGPWPPKILLLWVAVWYLLFLAVEVLWMNQVLRKGGPQSR